MIMMKNKRFLLALLLTFLISLLAGCSKGQDTVGTVTPTETATPAETVTPSETVTPTEAVTPTETAVPTEAVTPSVTEPDPALKEKYGFDFKVGSDGEILPEAIMPDLSVDYEISEADFSAEPEDIKGMFTKEDFPRVDGSTATIPISEAIYSYATGASAKEASEAIVHTKTSQSYYHLFDGDCDILIVYEPSDAVVELMKDNPCIIRPIGLDALVFMANTNNPVESLTMGQIQRIYTGEIENWNEVGGVDKPVYAFQRPIGTGSQNLIEKVVMGDLAMSAGDNVFRFYTMSDILEGMLTYNGDDNTLGYSVFYYANNMYYLPELRFMAVDGVLPSTQSIYDGSYKLVNPFYAVIRADEPADSGAHRLFDWLTSDTAQQMMIDLGYVPVNMPENAVFGGEQTFVKGNAEVFATEELGEGEYFVYYNRTTSAMESTYGDVIIFDNKWEPVMTFYDVELDLRYCGVSRSGLINLGQYRMTPEGEPKIGYGIYDIAAGKYTVEPGENYIECFDPDMGYFIMYDDNWQPNATDKNGNILLENLFQYESPTIRRCGDYYLEYTTIWDDEYFSVMENLCNIYDLELNLVKVLNSDTDTEELMKYTAEPEGYLTVEYGYDPESSYDSRVIGRSGEYAERANEESVLYLGGEEVFRSEGFLYAYELEDGSIFWESITPQAYALQGDYAPEILSGSDNVEYISLYDCLITKNGELCWKSDRPMNLTAIGNCFLQDFYGDYNTVYDTDGNVIIRKLNNSRVLD